MKKLYYSILPAFLFLATQTNAQRYLTEVFDSVQVTQDVEYGKNTSILSVIGFPLLQPLLLDIYEPSGDHESERPLVILIHDGSFLPFPHNGLPTGTRTDSAIVYLATRLAKMGYVVASIDYRLGWNPLGSSQDERVFTLVNAIYRGIQDARTCIRFFRKTVLEDGDPYRISPEKIMLWGEGVGGGIIVQCAASLDNSEELLIPKLIIPSFGPMIIESVNGNIDGTSVGIVPPGYPVFFAGDTLCHPNHAGFSSDFQIAVSMRGAVIDTSWLDGDGPGVIGFHVPSDPILPYQDWWLVVGPPILTPVIELDGSYLAMFKAQQLSWNSLFVGQQFEGDFSDIANERNDGLDGLFPLFGSIPADGAPWQWWDEANPNNAQGLQSNPDMSAEKGKNYCDTMLAYVAPRACMALDLGCFTTAYKEKIPTELADGLKISPNPATGEVQISLSANIIPDGMFRILAPNGSVFFEKKVTTAQTRIDLSGFPSGTYLLVWETKDGVFTGKLMR